MAATALIVAASACSAEGGRDASGPPAAAPSLVVFLVVDQLSAELLERYDSVFVGGLRRLLEEGHSFANATHDHAETSTAPGHTTLATGVYPSRHGIVANTWSELRDGQWRSVYSMEDPEASIPGFPEMPGRSPANMYRTGLADWIMEAHPDARVVSVSRKDRAAIGLAARSRGDVYWLSAENGVFITSTFYHTEYPEWIRRFNTERMPEVYGDTVWVNTTPPELWGLTRPDSSAYELDGVHSFFPHRPSERGDPNDADAVNEWRYDQTPFPDAAVIALAETALDELALGRRGVTDYLGISLSQTDLVGHRFGPLSREQLDNLLRLDRLLGEFLTTLDRQVGSGNWVLAFSSDHGVLEIPEHLAETGVHAERFTTQHTLELRRAVTAAANTGMAGGALAEAVKTEIGNLDFVEAGYTFAEVEALTGVDRVADAATDSFAVLFSRSHSRERAISFPARYGAHVRFPGNTLEAGSDPATHGSPYYYDRHVPLVFLGAGVQRGMSEEAVATVDAAPTLARLARIDAPSDLDGRVLIEP